MSSFARACARQRGVTLVEILVTVLIIAFGILGLIGMTVKAQSVQSESYQRAQAILLVRDMAGRLNANKTNGLQYVTTTPLGSGDSQPADCTGLTGATLDQCEWSNEIKGAAEQVATGAGCTTTNANCLGAMVGARGCITRISVNPSVYQVTVAWQGMTDLGAPSLSCGSGSYTRETLRRAISALVPLACLTAPATPCVTF